MIQIITDSTSGISQEEATELKITVLPVNIDFDNQIFYDGVNLSADEFYQKMEASDTWPATLQPNALEYLERFESAQKNDDEVLVIAPSAALSGIYHSAKLCADEAGYSGIAVLNSQNIAYGLRTVVLEAVALRQQKTLSQLVQHLQKFILHVHTFATTDNLDLLVKSERLSGSSALPKCILNIKPIIALQNGSIVYLDKKVGTKNALDFIIEKIKQEKVSSEYPIFVQHTRAPAKCDYPVSVLTQLFSQKSIVNCAMPYLVGCFLGDNAVAITFVSKFF